MATETRPHELDDAGSMIRKAYLAIDEHLRLLRRRVKFLSGFDPTWIGVPDFGTLIEQGWIGRQDFVDQTKGLVEDGVYYVLVVLHGKKAAEHSYGSTSMIDPKTDPALLALRQQAKTHSSTVVDKAIEGKDGRLAVWNAQLGVLESVKKALAETWRMMDFKFHDKRTLEDFEADEGEPG